MKHTVKLCSIIVISLVYLALSVEDLSGGSKGGDSISTKLKQSQVKIVKEPNEFKNEKRLNQQKEIVVGGPNEIEFELVYIEPGTFTMGVDTTVSKLFSILRAPEGTSTDEGPPRRVTITKGFYIGKYKVTAGQYCEFLNSPDVNEPEKFVTLNKWSRIIRKDGRYVPRPGTEDCTANTVPWDGANEFCQWIKRKTGRSFRLPTEAEWELTARGEEGRSYSWGEKEPGNSLWAGDEGYAEPWMGTQAHSFLRKYPFDVTPDGAVGMAGAVGEWVSDYYGYYPHKNETDPTGPDEQPDIWEGLDAGPIRVIRTGAIARNFGLDAEQGAIYGFRILMEADKKRIEKTKLSDKAMKRIQDSTVEFPRGGRLHYGSAKRPGEPLEDVIKIASGQSSSTNLAIKKDGSIIGWGWNDYDNAVPPDGNDFIGIATGYGYSLALRADGSIIGWGYNDFGQTDVPGGNDYTSITAGGGHNLALKADGTIVGWGDNRFGQATPPKGNDYAAIAAGFSHSLALKADGSIIEWGFGGFGDGRPPKGNDFAAIAAGMSFSLALKNNGSIVEWGLDLYGLSRPPKGNDFVSIAAGRDFGLALKADGSIVGWGNNEYGKARPPKGNDYVAIAAGTDHSLALKADGTVVGWGANWAGQGKIKLEE